MAWNAQCPGSWRKQMPRTAAGRECHLPNSTLPSRIAEFPSAYENKSGVWTVLQGMKNGLDMMKGCIFHLVLKWD
jgi:hypothetical protein